MIKKKKIVPILNICVRSSKRAAEAPPSVGTGRANLTLPQRVTQNAPSIEKSTTVKTALRVNNT